MTCAVEHLNVKTEEQDTGEETVFYEMAEKLGWRVFKSSC